MDNDGQSNGARLSSAEEEEVFTSASKDPLAEPVQNKGPGPRVSTVSSGPFEISPSSFSSPPPSAGSGPPSAIVQNAMERGRPQLSLGAIVGIGCAVFLVLVGLTLLLFR